VIRAALRREEVRLNGLASRLRKLTNTADYCPFTTELTLEDEVLVSVNDARQDVRRARKDALIQWMGINDRGVDYTDDQEWWSR